MKIQISFYLCELHRSIILGQGLELHQSVRFLHNKAICQKNSSMFLAIWQFCFKLFVERRETTLTCPLVIPIN